MKAIATICCWIFGLACGLGPSALWANDGNFFDYLPKYRKFRNNHQIDKIEYRNKRTIVYFRQVIQDEKSVFFYSGDHQESWYMRTPPRMRGLEVQFKLLETREVRINDELKLESLTSVPEVEVTTKRGDVLTFEMHFVRTPNYIRMLDLIQGKDGDLDEDRLNCFDIMIKTKDSPLLGAPDNADVAAKRFEQAIPGVQPKVKAEPSKPQPAKAEPTTVANRDNTAVKPTPAPTPAPKPKKAEPIDYMPQQMVRIEDLRCSERVILPNVQFRDNETKFAGRAKAMENITVLVTYMQNYPDAKLRLHGHTDIFGDPFRNLELSKERVMEVKHALVAQGIRPERIDIFYHGGQQPLKKYPNGGDPNRRVEAEPICEGGATELPKSPSGPQLSIREKN